MIELSITYDNLQSHGGIIRKRGLDRPIHFVRLEVVGNSLVVYGNDNGATKGGRMSHIFNFDLYYTKFEDYA